jgi:lipid-A-disaccharide synthase
MVVAYRANPVTVAVARRIVRVPHIALANIVAGRRAAPEFLQQACTASNLAPAVENILLDAATRNDQIECFRGVARRLGIGGPAPSELAAAAILRTIGKRET